MLRVTHQRPLNGFGSVSIGIDSDSIARSVVNAVMPAIVDQVPNLVAAAWPAIQERVPELIGNVWPDVQNRVMGLVPTVISQVEGQVPAMVNQALPILYKQLPTIGSKVMPIVTKELEAQLQKYTAQYLGPIAAFKKYAPVAVVAFLGVTLLGAGLNIYRFWEGN